jgi:hypothetical protein
MIPVRIWPWFFSSRGGSALAELEAVHWRCLLAARGLIQQLGLDGLDASAVVIRKVPVATSLGGTDLPLPAVVLTPFGPEHMNRLRGTNAKDDVEYPVLVSIVDHDEEDPSPTRLGRYLRWRQRIAREFRNQRLPGVPEVIGCWIEPSAIVAADLWLKGFYHSSLLLWFVSREPRGMN